MLPVLFKHYQLMIFFIKHHKLVDILLLQKIMFLNIFALWFFQYKSASSLKVTHWLYYCSQLKKAIAIKLSILRGAKNIPSPARRYSCEPWRLSWLWWRATSSGRASSRWPPWGNVWRAVTRAAGWARGAQPMTGRCRRSARGWWPAAASPAKGYRPLRSPKIPLGLKQRPVAMLKSSALGFQTSVRCNKAEVSILQGIRTVL